MLNAGDIGLESAPLIARLVEDLVHTTESYRSLKLGLAKRGQEAEQWQSKADALRRDAERVLQENNRLHMDMLEMTEKLQQRDRAEFVAQVRNGTSAGLCFCFSCSRLRVGRRQFPVVARALIWR